MNSEYKSAVNNFLSSLFPHSEMPHQKIYDAAKYTLLLPGKRLRPLLTMAVIDTQKMDPLPYISAICSSELIHTYSLIHDDLPCMDDDDFRRGKPAAHIAFDEATALLAGDLLQTHAFALIAETSALTYSQRIDLISALTYAAGGEGMIGGQVLDLMGSEGLNTFSALNNLHFRKTGALIGYSLQAGGIIAGIQNHKTLFEAGVLIGLAFQIIDDILDETQSSETLGKPARSDSKNKKTTALSFHDIDSAQAYAETCMDKSMTILQSILGTSPYLDTLLDSVTCRVS